MFALVELLAWEKREDRAKMLIILAEFTKAAAVSSNQYAGESERNSDGKY